MSESTEPIQDTRTWSRRKRSEVQPPQSPEAASETEAQIRRSKRLRGRAEQTAETSGNAEGNTSSATDNVNVKAPDEVTYPVTEEIPQVALKIMRAIKKAHRIPSIGYSPTQLDEQAEHMMSYGPDDLSKDKVETSLELTEEEKTREKHNTDIITKLSDIYTAHVHNQASGYLDKPFNLKVTMDKCGFNGPISPPTRFDYDDPIFEQREEKAIESRLKKWYKNASVSGYGDVREQVTKVNEEVRNAREIPVTHFSVEAELLERVAALWDQNFYPNRSIRVEPYKIHLYGPDGHFDMHRDTPQKDLIGTFLLGLGDTSRGGGLEVDGENMPAHGGHWCAFYPDVPHRVERIWYGHRAVIAFKIFRTSGSGTETETTARVRQEVTELMSQMQAPFGIMLERKYCMGTTELSGFDALLLQSASALPNVDVRHLPVVLTTHSEFGSQDRYDCYRDFEMRCDTDVAPFTRGHVEELFNTDGEYSCIEHSKCGCPWLEGVKNVPFFSLELPRTLYACSEEEQETCNYVGNEAQAWREDSVYLSYGLLVLPKNDDTSKGNGKDLDDSDGTD
ncbi:hypothetical protein L226DRAFT_484383 [Lentinus tigrinus ALCF2SS1-7]|uniref:Fe2OG dioxygenase domain-containing protein n=1 Tax=Lentinus tigrinus ALCF2SS1-6 TaxID=1328759 RepID=A0A5C2SMK1_9APHY|nr:hypothetical protein L227DRAFT_650545 [Lentinus tigrinus ALCF2SS1-6]RPD76587.1 hypothetical protein L226DRAFT_484383 [Lentinus tigrinus ALCF2SS1-7]